MSVILVLGLSGCSTSGDAGASGEPSAVASSPATASSATPGGGESVDAGASPDLTLTPEERQAFEDATNTVVAYRQTIVDLYTGARTNLNDLNDVATGELLDQNLKNVQQGLAAGRTANPPGVRVDLVDSRIVRSSMESKPKEMVLLVCIDATAGTTTEPDGTPSPGKREALEYTVIATDYLPAPGWAVSHVAGAASEAARAC